MKGESELRCAARYLGIKEVFFLDYRDSGMPGSVNNHHPLALIAQPIDVVAGKVVQLIRILEPQDVITFDPIGGYRHPDHIHIHEASVLAFENANNSAFLGDGSTLRQPDYLYFHTIPRGLFRFGVKMIRLFGGDPGHWGKNKDIDLTFLAEIEYPTHMVVNYGGG